MNGVRDLVSISLGQTDEPERLDELGLRRGSAKDWSMRGS